MNGANSITIDTSEPQDTASAGLGDDHIRSVKTTFQSLLNDEHNVPTGSANNVGYHLKGSARPYYGTQSRVSSSGTDARIMVTSDTTLLFGVGSGGTALLGAGPTSLSLGSTYGQMTFPQRSYWVEEFGQGTTNSSGQTTLTFPNSGYSGSPYLWITGIAPSAPALYGGFAIFSTATPGKTTATINALFPPTGSGVSGANFFWRSLGSRAL